MTKRILISGSSGQVGSCLVEHFSKKYEVIGLDIKKSGIPAVDRITTLGDIRNKDIVNNLVKKVDTVIHTAAQLSIPVSIENPVFDAEINVMGTLNLLNATKSNTELSRFIYVSTSAVYGESKYLPIDEKHPLNPMSPYGLSKLTAENYCMLFHKIYGLPVVCIRPFNIYGDRENPKKPYSSIIARFNDMVSNNKKITIYGDGKQLRDFIHSKDIVSFIDLLLEKPEATGEVYNVASGKPTTIIEIVKLILKENKKNIEENIQYKRSEKGKIKDIYGDVKKSRKIGFKPKITLEEGIKEVVESIKKNNKQRLKE